MPHTKHADSKEYIFRAKSEKRELVFVERSKYIDVKTQHGRNKFLKIAKNFCKKSFILIQHFRIYLKNIFFVKFIK
jgi:hypothetical protein